MKKRDRLFSSFKYFFIFATIVFIAVECLVLYAFSYNTRIEAENIGQRSIFEAEQVVNPIFRENERLIYMLSQYVDGVLVEGASPEEIEYYLSIMTKRYREELDENFFGVFGVVDGTYINGEGYDPGSDYVPNERIWYKEAMDANGKIGITSPYIDFQTGEYVISFSKKLADNRGVIAIDIWIEDMRSVTQNISTDGIEAVYIADSDENIIFHSMPDFVGKNYKSDPQNDDERALYKAITENKNSVFEINLRGNNCMVFNTELNDSWRAVVIVDLIKEFQSNIPNIVLFSLILIISFAAIIYTAYQYDRRRRFAENLTRQLKAASAIYRSVHLLDFEKDTFQELNSMNDIHSLVGELSFGVNKTIRNALMHFVTDKLYRQLILDFIDFETLDERMRGKITISQEFIGNVSGWCRARFIAVEYDDNGKLKKVLFTIEVIDEEKRLEHQLRFLSEMDGLTGINNRATGERVIKELMANEKEGMFCLLDADRFKAINDTFGHGVGDKVLISIANSLKESFRDRDVVMRLGGDEFAVFAVNVTDIEVAKNILDRLFDSIDRIHIPEMKSAMVKISLGAAFYKLNEEISFDDLYNKADERMYASKKHEDNYYTLDDC